MGFNPIRIFTGRKGTYSDGQQAAGQIGNSIGTAGSMSGVGLSYHQNGGNPALYVESAQALSGIAGYGTTVGKANPFLGLIAFGLKLGSGESLKLSDYAGLAASILSLPIFGPVGVAVGAAITVAGVAYEVYRNEKGEITVTELPTEKDEDGDAFVPFGYYYYPYQELLLYPDPSDEDKETPKKEDAEKVKSPLAIDLDGDGIATYAIKNGVYFDIDSDGFAEKTAWLNAKDAFLAIDRNKNGIIDDASELFGDSDKAVNGFEALKALDSNGDGVIDANDAGWEELMLWVDAVNDGVSTDNELITAADAGIAYIELNYKNQDVTDENGNQHRQTATVHWQDGRTTVIEDIWFQHNNAQTIDLTPLDVTDEEWAEIAELPYIDAFGNVHSLWVAMSLDARNDEFFTKSSDFQAA